MSGFFLTPMTRFYAEVLQNMNHAAGGAAVWQTGGTDAGSAVSGQGSGTGAGFAGVVQEKLSQKEGAVPDSPDRIGGRDEAMIQAMSREEYKFYIYQQIAGIPMHPSQKWDAVCVNISEEGFAAMQADPAYEKWVQRPVRQLDGLISS